MSEVTVKNKVKVCEIICEVETETCHCWIIPPFTTMDVKRILKKLLDNDLKSVKVNL